MTHEVTAAAVSQIDFDQRRNGIGGSDIGAIAGLSPWKSPLAVYLEKTGARLPEDGDNEHTRWGKALEDVIAARYEEETGRKVIPGGLLVHPSRPWQRGNVDRYAQAEAERILLEIKNVGWRQAYRWGEPGTDEVPEEYLAQAAWYLALAPECSHAELPVLVDGHDFRVYRVERNPELEAALVAMGESFWRDHVEKGIPPPADGSKSAREWLARQYPRETGPALLRATPTVEEWAAKLKDARSRLNTAEADKQLAENRLKELIGPAAGVEGDGWRITWKATKGRPVVDWKAISAEVGIAPEIIEKHTKRTAVRMFRPTFPGLAEEG